MSIEYFLRSGFDVDLLLGEDCSRCRVDFVGDGEGDLMELLDADFFVDCLE